MLSWSWIELQQSTRIATQRWALSPSLFELCMELLVTEVEWEVQVLREVSTNGKARRPLPGSGFARCCRMCNLLNVRWLCQSCPWHWNTVGIESVSEHLTAGAGDYGRGWSMLFCWLAQDLVFIVLVSFQQYSFKKLTRMFPYSRCHFLGMYSTLDFVRSFVC